MSTKKVRTIKSVSPWETGGKVNDLLSCTDLLAVVTCKCNCQELIYVQYNARQPTGCFS